jgi:hypothetical protein
MKIRRRTSAEIAAPLDQLHSKSSLRQRTRRTHAGHAAANHRHTLRRIVERNAQSLFLELNE